MPVSYRSRQGSAERAYQTALDWTRRLMQLSVLITALLYVYLLYGLFVGDVGNWASLDAAARTRITSNISMAVMGLNVALAVLIVTVCILYYDEEALGYLLIAGSIALYYGLPFLLEQMLGNQFASWTTGGGNQAAFAIMNQFKVAALILVAPGIVLMVRDVVLRVAGGMSHKREKMTAMQYGGNVHEEEQPNKALIGVVAKCWQLPYCRDAIRKGCPIYHARTRCWRERVGCMCEESVIRHAMDAVIGKELINIDKKDEPNKDDPLGAIGSLAIAEPETKAEPTVAAAQEKTEEYPPRTAHRPPPSPRNVKIPHNPNVPMSVKIQRCKNCVIYNEHQRMKYQFFAPIFVLIIPGVSFFEAPTLSEWLNRALATVDKLMSQLSLTASGAKTDIATSISAIGFANYVVIGALVVILTTMSLRFLEYLIFKLKV